MAKAFVTFRWADSARATQISREEAARLIRGNRKAARKGFPEIPRSVTYDPARHSTTINLDSVRAIITRL